MLWFLRDKGADTEPKKPQLKKRCPINNHNIGVFDLSSTRYFPKWADMNYITTYI